MGRKKYRLTLNRVKRKTQKRPLIPSHSTPIKKSRIEDQEHSRIDPVSPIKELQVNENDCESFVTNCLDITTEKCAHNFSFDDAMCDKCGLFCIQSKQAVTFVGNKNTTEENVQTHDLKCDNDLCEVLTLAENKLKESGQSAFLHMLLTVIASGRLSAESLTFSILSETVQALSVDSLTQQRYSWKSKCFWKLFMTKCGGMAIRLLSGWKGIGTLLTEETTPGFINSEMSDIILAIPNEDILRNFDPYDGNWPTKMKPGFCDTLASPLAERVKDTSVCVSLDGKKLTPGLKGDKGDVNLLGKEENGICVEKRLELFNSEQSKIDSIKTHITSSQVSDDKSLANMFHWALTHVSQQSISLQDELKKKGYILEKLKKMGGDDYKTSRYCFAIQQVIASQVEIRESLVTGENLRDRLIRLLASIHGKQSLLLDTPVDLTSMPNFCSLHNIDELLNSKEEICQKLAAFIQDQGPQSIKQRSEIWFAQRKKVVATGSTLYAATGADGLKAQREHFLQTVLGKEPEEFSEEVQHAIEHGQETEPHAIATFCTRFLPSLLPDHVLYEIGGIPLQTGGIDILVSPDGALLNTKTGQIDAVLEVKCPFTADLHTSIPKRYYLQVQAEIFALDVHYAYFMTYKNETARIFKINRDESTWNLATLCLKETFSNNSKRVPTRLNQMSKLLTEKIKQAVLENCTLLAEMSTVKSKACESNDIQIGIPFSSHAYPDIYLTDITDLPSALNKEEAMNIVEILHVQNKNVHQIMRKKATEIVTLVASDTDRMWSKNQSPGVPVNYFLKGYSLSMTVMRAILEDTLDKLHGYGIHVPCVAFDGQFMKLLREDGKGRPQTLLQLQKGFWQSVCKMSKSVLVSEIKNAGVVHSEADIHLQHLTKENGSRYVLLERPGQNVLPKTSLKYLNNSPVNSTCNDVDECEFHGDQLQTDDTTEVDLSKNVRISANDEGGTRKSLFLSEETIAKLLDDLSVDHNNWKNKSVTDLRSTFSNCQELSKLRLSEVKVVARFLKQHLDYNISPTGSKTDLLKTLKCLLEIEGDIVYTRRRKTPLSLKILAAKKLASTKYPKLALSVSYANWKFPEIVKDWQENSKVKHGMVIPEVEPMRELHWFYIPTSSASRSHQLEVMKIDPHHLLTRHRSAVCKGNLGNAQKSHFIEIAKENTTALKLGMMEQQLNMQSTDYAKITFSRKVQDEMDRMGYHDSANICQYVREWFEACDDPGLGAVERCQRKLRYRDYLLSLVDLSNFPPPGSHINGYPLPLWEATVASIDADFFMYAITKRQTYNNRSLSSQPCESLYSCLATMPGAKNGVPSAVDLEINMAKICGECIVRQDPTRGFSTRLSSAPVYPEVLLEKGVGPLSEPHTPPTYITQISIKDHLFDAKERRRRARQEPKGLSSPHEPGRGAVGVRHYHKVNETTLNPLIRAGRHVN